MGAGYDPTAAAFVAKWIINFRRTALVVGWYISVKLSIAADCCVRIVVYSTATIKAVRHIINVAIATNVLTRIVISVATTA